MSAPLVPDPFEPLRRNAQMIARATQPAIPRIGFDASKLGAHPRLRSQLAKAAGVPRVGLSSELAKSAGVSNLSRGIAESMRPISQPTLRSQLAKSAGMSNLSRGIAESMRPITGASALTESMKSITGASAFAESMKPINQRLATATEGFASIMAKPDPPVRSPVMAEFQTRMREIERDTETTAEIVRTAQRARVEREEKMLEAMQAMQAALAEASRSEALSLERAEQAEAREIAAQERSEQRDRFMVRVTVASAVIAFLSLIAAVVTIFA